MQARSIVTLAVSCALVPLLALATLLGLTSTTSLAQSQTSQSGLSQQALLQIQTPIATHTSTPTPIPQATPTPTLAPTLAPSSSVATLSPVTAATPSAFFGTTTSAAATPFVASVVGTPFASAVSSPVPVSSGVPLPSVSSPQGLPTSAIFVPGGAGATASGASAAPASVASSNLGGSYNQVIDATQGGTLALPDGSLQLAVPGGVADTDFVLVSLTEVASSSASGNLQVGNRVFALTVVDSGGMTVTNFGTPILVTATTPAGPGLAATTSGSGIAALDPSSGQFNSITTDTPPGQLMGSLDKLAPPATTGVPDASLNIASTRGTASQQQQQPQSAGAGRSDDPARVLSGLGLTP